MVAGRFLLFAMAAIPGVMMLRGGLTHNIGRSPWFADAPDPLPLQQFLSMSSQVPRQGVGMAMAAALFSLLIGWFLAAGLVDLLARGRRDGEPLSRQVGAAGSLGFLPFLRVALLGLAFHGSLAGGTAMVFERLVDHGYLAGWSGKTLSRDLFWMRIGVTLFAMHLVGVFAFWCRVVIVADKRRYVRRVIGLVLSLSWRAPLRGFAAHLFLGLLLTLADAWLIVAWRQSALPTDRWLAAWLLMLAVASVVWAWRLHAAVLLWTSSRFDDLRSVPDAPFGIVTWLRSRISRTAPQVAPVSWTDEPRP
ncbi:hypothetical protein ABI59_13485 [Acidobacteria bacterium Mor1]|nr:hypothetical protein ABI59_13485 [Acidobacteria bacterium Mor1]